MKRLHYSIKSGQLQTKIQERNKKPKQEVKRHDQDSQHIEKKEAPSHLNLVSSPTELSILRHLSSRGNLKLYNRYISEAAKRKNLSFAERLFAQLNHQSQRQQTKIVTNLTPSLKPDVFTYTCMINACARSFASDQAEKYFEEMKINGIKGNEVTFTTMIKNRVNTMQTHAAILLLEEMLQVGIEPNPRTFNTLLRGLVKTGDLQLMNKVWALNNDAVSDATSLECKVRIEALNMKVKEASETFSALKKISKSLVGPCMLSNSSTPSQYAKISPAGQSHVDHNLINPNLYLIMASVGWISHQWPIKRVKKWLKKFDRQTARMANLIPSSDAPLSNQTNLQKNKQSSVLQAFELDAHSSNYLPNHDTHHPTIEKMTSKNRHRFIMCGSSSSPPCLERRWLQHHVDQYASSRTNPFPQGLSFFNSPLIINGFGGDPKACWRQLDSTNDKCSLRKLEICSGSGEWLLKHLMLEENDQEHGVSQHSGGNHLVSTPSHEPHWAVLEIRFDRAHDIWRQLVLSNRTNVTIIYGDAKYLNQLVEARSVNEIYIRFPEPPPSRHSPQRLITRAFLEQVVHIMHINAILTIITDDTSYSEWIQEDASQIPNLSMQAYQESGHEESNQNTPNHSFFDTLWAKRKRNERYIISLKLSS